MADMLPKRERRVTVNQEASISVDPRVPPKHVNEKLERSARVAPREQHPDDKRSAGNHGDNGEGGKYKQVREYEEPLDKHKPATVFRLLDRECNGVVAPFAHGEGRVAVEEEDAGSNLQIPRALPGVRMPGLRSAAGPRRRRGAEHPHPSLPGTAGLRQRDEERGQRFAPQRAIRPSGCARYRRLTLRHVDNRRSVLYPQRTDPVD